MFFVYVLYSQKDGKLYVGYTSDFDERMKCHEAGEVPSTKLRRPLQLIGYEAYLSQTDAKRREQFLKGGMGREQLKIQYQDIFNQINYRFR